MFFLQRVRFKMFESLQNILIRVVFFNFHPSPISTTGLTRSTRDTWQPLRLWTRCVVSQFLTKKKKKFCNQTKPNQSYDSPEFVVSLKSEQEIWRGDASNVTSCHKAALHSLDESRKLSQEREGRSIYKICKRQYLGGGRWGS